MSDGRATARYVRGSAQKARLVLDLIRGQDVDKAMAVLRFARKSVAKDVEKVLRSAVANAQQKEGGGGDLERLFVRECFANQGPTLKRIRAAPMGRAFRILKRSSHLTVGVGQRPDRASVVTRVGEPDAPSARKKKAGARTSTGGARKRAAKKKTAKKTTTKKKATGRAAARSTKAATKPSKTSTTRKKTAKKKTQKSSDE